MNVEQIYISERSYTPLERKIITEMIDYYFTCKKRNINVYQNYIPMDNWGTLGVSMIDDAVLILNQCGLNVKKTASGSAQYGISI